MGTVKDISAVVCLLPMLGVVSLVEWIGKLKPTRSNGFISTAATSRGRLILMAVDETSGEAVQWAIRQLFTPNDFIHLVHVAELEDELAQLPIPSTIKGLQDTVETLLTNGIKFDGCIVPTGGADKGTHRVLLEIIDQVNPDLVVLGSSKRTGL